MTGFQQANIEHHQQQHHHCCCCRHHHHHPHQHHPHPHIPHHPHIIHHQQHVQFHNNNDYERVKAVEVESIGSGSSSENRIFASPTEFSTFSCFKKLGISAAECFPYSLDSEGATSLFVQRWIDTIASLDMILLAISIILILTTETYLRHNHPINLDYTLLINRTISGASGDVGAPTIYNLTVIALLALGMGYFILEVWLFCVLVKIGRQRPNLSFCVKWISWRSVILGVALLILIFDLGNSHQATCGELIFVPFQIVRMIIGGVPVVWVISSGIHAGR